MTKEREALSIYDTLTLALEALEAAYARLVTKCEQNLVTFNGVDVDTLTLSQEAITAIKEALSSEAMTSSPNGEAQPEQRNASEHLEPVALQMDVIVVNLVREGINKHRARELAEHFIKHTTPPQRKPLTDEEIGAILEGVNAYGTRLYTFARAIEAAHGIKE